MSINSSSLQSSFVSLRSSQMSQELESWESDLHQHTTLESYTVNNKASLRIIGSKEFDDDHVYEILQTARDVVPENSSMDRDSIPKDSLNRCAASDYGRITNGSSLNRHFPAQHSWSSLGGPPQKLLLRDCHVFESKVLSSPMSLPNDETNRFQQSRSIQKLVSLRHLATRQSEGDYTNRALTKKRTVSTLKKHSTTRSPKASIDPNSISCHAVGNSRTFRSMMNEWLERIFTTRYETPARIVTSADVEEAMEIAERGARRATQLAELSPMEREAAGQNDLECSAKQASNKSLSVAADSEKEKLGSLNMALAPTKLRTCSLSLMRQSKRVSGSKALRTPNGSANRTDVSDTSDKCKSKQEEPVSCWERTADPNIHRRGNPFDKSPTSRWPDWSTYAAAVSAMVLGLSNIVKVPYFMFYFDGRPWLIAQVVVGAFIVIPLCLLEVALGQVFQGGILVWPDAISSRSRGLAIVMALVGFVTASTQTRKPTVHYYFCDVHPFCM